MFVQSTRWVKLAFVWSSNNYKKALPKFHKGEGKAYFFKGLERVFDVASPKVPWATREAGKWNMFLIDNLVSKMLLNSSVSLYFYLCY